MDELVIKAKSGSHKAFEEIVSLYEKKVYHLALRYTGSREDSLDICQEVFLRVWRFLPGFDLRSSFSTWLFRITANVCIDTLKKKRGFLSENGEMPDIPDKKDDFEAVDSRELIEKALGSLSEDHRKVIVLRDISGLSYEEIADCLGLEMGTVKSRINRARTELRNFLVTNGNKT